MAALICFQIFPFLAKSTTYVVGGANDLIRLILFYRAVNPRVKSKIVPTKPNCEAPTDIVKYLFLYSHKRHTFHI